MRRKSLILLASAVIAACHTGPSLPDADAIVEGRAAGIVPDTVDDNPTVKLEAGHWSLRQRSEGAYEFWEDISALDLRNAEKSARSIDERTFAVALRTLMTSDPEGAAVAFRALTQSAKDPVVRSRARVGLTMALSWRADWAALATIGPDPDTLDTPTDSLARHAAVERWGQALAYLPPAQFDMPDNAVTLPLRKSGFGTPVITVRVNGKPHEFWLDTGASMTLLSASVALEAGVRLASRDTLALGVVAGHIPARAALIDSLAFGPIVARGLTAALVDATTLRMDHRIVNGVTQSVEIDGVIGTDLLRQLDIVVDAGASTITIKKPRRDPRLVRNLYWIGYPVVRLVAADGRPMLFGLDTGAEGTYVTMSLLRKMPKTRVAMRRGSIGGLGTEQHRTEWVARDVMLSDGDYAMGLHNIPVAPDRRWTFVNFDGVIGSDIALHARMHLDFVNGVFDIRQSSIKSSVAPVTIGH
jgi:predicted aspartyl protease